MAETQAQEKQDKQETQPKVCQSVAVADAGPCKKKLTVQIAAATVKKEFDEAMEELRKTVAVPGFRTGRVPRDVVELKFKKQVETDVRQSLVEKAVHEALEEKSLKALGHPHVDDKSVEFEGGKPMKFDAEVLIHPVFDLPEYKGIKAKRKKTAVEAGEVDKAIEGLRKQRAQWVPVEGKIGEKDLVICSIKLETEGLDPIARDEFVIQLEEEAVGEIPVPGLAKTLAGKTAGEEVSVEVEIPVTFSDEKWRKKKAKIGIKIQEAKSMKLPELDDELAKQFGEESVKALHASVEKAISKEKEKDAEMDVENQLLVQLLEKTKVELPEELVKSEAASLMRRYYWSLRSRGYADETIEGKMGEIGKHSEEEAVRRLRSFFLLEKIAEKEKIFVSEQEVERHVAALASRSGQRPEKFRSQLEREGELGQIRVQLREDKVIQALRAKAQIA